jgi:hypothetical protein
MIFTHHAWNAFCEKLHEENIHSIHAKDVSGNTASFLVLKHDVETDVPKAFQLAKIEHRYGHKGSYYVQAYLLRNKRNISLLQQMQNMGHEISYHYDVMDACKGNLDQAITEFEENRKSFEESGFPIHTVCQHGNPIVERIGYTSNRDFFRSNRVQRLYPFISDIKVDFPQKNSADYSYYSDAGRQFKRVFDPLNNDIADSSDKDTVFRDLSGILTAIRCGGSHIVSIHPHRWTPSAISYLLKLLVFKAIRFAANLLAKIPIFKKILGKFYFLAKKF